MTEFNTQQQHKHLILDIKGDLNQKTRDDFLENLKANIEDDNNVIINCEDLQYITEDGAAALVEAQAFCQQRHLKLSLANVHEKLNDRLKKLNLPESIARFETMDLALK